jgi:flagellar motor switch protein FliG
MEICLLAAKQSSKVYEYIPPEYIKEIKKQVFTKEEMIVEEVEYKPFEGEMGYLGKVIKEELEKLLHSQKDINVINRIKSSLEQLESKLTVLLGRRGNARIDIDGLEYITEILNLFSSTPAGKKIIEVLENENPELIDYSNRRNFKFADIVKLDDRDIQSIILKIDFEDIAKALKIADTEVQNKIFKNMTKRAAEMLKEEMENMGQIEQSEAEEACQKIRSIIFDLGETGEIVIQN